MRIYPYCATLIFAACAPAATESPKAPEPATPSQATVLPQSAPSAASPATPAVATKGALSAYSIDGVNLSTVSREGIERALKKVGYKIDPGSTTATKGSWELLEINFHTKPDAEYKGGREATIHIRRPAQKPEKAAAGDEKFFSPAHVQETFPALLWEETANLYFNITLVDNGNKIGRQVFEEIAKKP